jgi:hypothetical protein
MDVSELVSQEFNRWFSFTTRDVYWKDRLSGLGKIQQNAAQTLKRVAAMRDHDEIHHIQTAKFQERQSIPCQGANIRLKMCRAMRGVNLGWAPDLHGQDVERAKKGPRIVDGKDSGDEPSRVLVGASGFGTSGYWMIGLLGHGWASTEQNDGNIEARGKEMSGHGNNHY